MGRETIEWWRLQIGGLLMALGIGTMHYTGMEAMRMNGLLRYDVKLFILSIMVAHLLATSALYIQFALSKKESTFKHWAKLTSSMVMGHAVAGMHYTAMAAARFYVGTGSESPALSYPPLAMGISICVVMSLILGVLIIGTVIDHRFDKAAESLEASEAWADAIVNTAADGIISIESDGTITSFNKAAERIFGYTVDEFLGRHVELLIAAPDSNTHNEGSAFDWSTSLHRLDGNYREVTGKRKDSTMFALELGVGTLQAAPVPRLGKSDHDQTRVYQQ
jgi:PAS domain S-box-containing protein